MHDKVALVVVGVHRSGTSAITRILSLLGARLPGNLMRPLAGINDRGFWESADVQELNDDALRAAGSSWEDIRPIPPGWFQTRAATEYGARIRRLLDDQFDEAPLFVLKDPRLCRLIPLWENALEDFGAEPRFVHIFRNPLEVAASLAKRDGFSTSKSQMLWLRYALSAERDSRNRARTFVAFDGLLRNWADVIAKISRELAISWPLPIDDIRSEVDRFLSPSSRHHVRDDQATAPEVPDAIWQIYKALGHLALYEPSDDRYEDALADFDSIRKLMQSADDLYAPIVTKTNRRQSLEIAGAGSVEEAERLREENRGLREKLTRLEQQIRSKDFELGRRDRELQSLDRQVATQAATLRSARRKLARLVRGVRELQLLDSTGERR